MEISSEAQLYQPVSSFLKDACHTNPMLTGYASHKHNSEEENIQISLNLLGRQIIPDVYGIDENEMIYLVEAKLIQYDIRSIDEAVTQAVAYQRFSHFVYVAFNFDENLSNFEYAKQICLSFGIGILNIHAKEDKLIATELLKPTFVNYDKYYSVPHEYFKNIKQCKDKITNSISGNDFAIYSSRAYLIRDLVFYLHSNPIQKEEDLSPKYKIKNNSVFLTPDAFKSYWTAMSYPKGSTTIETTYENRLWYSLQGARILGIIHKNSLSLTLLGEQLVRMTDATKVFTTEYSDGERDFFNTLILQTEEIKLGLELSKGGIKKNVVFEKVSTELGYPPAIFQFAINSEILYNVQTQNTFNMISRITYTGN